MKRQNLHLLLILCLSIILVPSCTIQKRTVNKGYFVQWHLDKKIKTQKVNSDDLSATKEKEDEIEINQTETTNTSEITSTTEQNSNENTSDSDFKPTSDFHANLETSNQVAKIVDFKTECFTNGKEVSSKILKKIKKPKPAMDGELIINIVLTIVFLAAAILFTLLAIKAAAGLMLYVWALLALVAFIIFVTQVIDVIMW